MTRHASRRDILKKTATLAAAGALAASRAAIARAKEPAAPGTGALSPHRLGAAHSDEHRRTAWHRRHGRDRERRRLRGHFRQPPAARRAGDDARYRVPHRLDGEADHLGRRAAARRARQTVARRAGARHRSRAQLAAGAGRIRCGRETAFAPAQAADCAASLADPYRRLHLPALGRRGDAISQGGRQAPGGGKKQIPAHTR